MQNRIAYRCETPRLVLRCWEPADAPVVFSLVSENAEHLGAWLPWVKSRPGSAVEQSELFRQFRANFDTDREYVFGAFTKEGECVGSIGLHRSIGPRGFEVGYWVRADCCGRGLATEMAAAACSVAFYLPTVELVEIHCAPQNVPSLRVAQKLGFVHEATLSKRLSWSNGLHDMMVWSLWRDAARTSLQRFEVAAFDALGERLPSA